jgi:hypothetical protein
VKRNTHVWKTRTPEGERREVRAEKFGKRWRLQAKLSDDERWTYYEVPLLEDLVELRDVLWRKYQRKHLSWDDIVAMDALLAERRKGEAPDVEVSSSDREQPN